MEDRDLLQAGYRYALSLRARADDAEDLVQEAWYRLHRHGGQVGGKAHLFTAIRNLYVDRWRRDRMVVFEPLDDPDGVADDRPDPLDMHMDALFLARHLAALRSVEREALFLNVVEGYTAAEISEFTGSSRGAVLSLIHRAKQKLRKALAPQPADTTPVIIRKGSAP